MAASLPVADIQRLGALPEDDRFTSERDSRQVFTVWLVAGLIGAGKAVILIQMMMRWLFTMNLCICSPTSLLHQIALNGLIQAINWRLWHYWTLSGTLLC